MNRTLGAFALLAAFATAIAPVPALGSPAGDGPNAAEPPSTARVGPAVSVRVALDPSGAVDLGELVAKVAEATGSDAPPASSIRLPATGLSGALTRSLLADRFGASARVEVGEGELVVTLVADPGAESWAVLLDDLARRAVAEAGRREAFGLRARESYRANDPSRPTVCLVHGLNSTSGSFRHMVPHLEAAGFGVITYDYPVNRDLAESAARFALDWKALRESNGDRLSWAILTHSMGGLIARDYVEGSKYDGDVSRLILIGPPNSGASLAKLQTILQLMEGVRGARSGALDAVGDGLGESADDLQPGSGFLRRLNARPRREGVEYHILAGSTGFLTAEGRRELEGRLGLVSKAGGPLGRLARLAVGDVTPGLDELTEGTGDGCVAVASTSLEGAPEPVVIPANHVELIRGPLLFKDPGPVVSMPYVLRWLGKPETTATASAP